ncbi:hypothetical protein F53441_11723 [Fusarium austroafricanum]|uniref:Uncharacterized protein n=1 Tax=Fusarium austroafricanum TaxID=2364996 RepID=A0A8H4K0P0_9HYPO|nr:hypothetical protein F53441_11723 [Fusarium austroafricanum]
MSTPAKPNQQNPKRFPLNDTAIATAPDGSTTRLSLITLTPTSQASTTQGEDTSFSFPGQTLSTENVEATSLETIPPASTFDSSVNELSITAQLSQDSTTSSTTPSISLTLETQLRSLSGPSSSRLFQAISGSTASPKDNFSDHDEDATSVETKDDLQATAQRRPHQGFAYSFTQLAPNNTKLQTQTCGPGYESPCGWIPTVATRGNGTYTPGPWTSGTLTVIAPTSLEPCTTLQDDEPITEYSIVYTSTVTFFGNRSDYTPPYPTISTPNFCETEAPSPFPTFSKGRPSEGAGASESQPFPGAELTKEPPQDCSRGKSCTSERPPAWSNPTGVPNPAVPGLTMSSRMTVTFVTTDKNPAVVFPTERPPHFDRPPGGGGLPMSNKQLPEPSKVPSPDRPDSSGGRGKSSPHSIAQPDTKPQPSLESRPGDRPGDRPQGDPRPQQQPKAEPEPPKIFYVTARGQEVIVNDKTFSSLMAGQTTTVTVDDGTFTIHPTEIVGEGTTVKKPQPAGTVVSVIRPTSATIGRVPVTVSGTEAVVGGTRLKIPIWGTTTRLKVPIVGSNTVVERQVSIAPGKVVVDDETLTYHGVGGPQTDVIIEGGEMVTAVGRSVFVFHSTTITYGPAIPVTTETVDDDTITVGPAGVVVDETTLGGSNAGATDTKYRIVGGATITKVAPSYIIIDGTTFTAGPGSKSTTKEAGGETITIGPKGIIIGTMTVTYPFGPSKVATIEAKATVSDKLPIATGTNNDNGKEGSKDKKDDDSGSISQRPSLAIRMTGLCIAVGVWFLV